MYLFPNNNFFNLRPHNIVVESQSEQRSEEGGGGGGMCIVAPNWQLVPEMTST